MYYILYKNIELLMLHYERIIECVYYYYVQYIHDYICIYTSTYVMKNYDCNDLMNKIDWLTFEKCCFYRNSCLRIFYYFTEYILYCIEVAGSGTC